MVGEELLGCFADTDRGRLCAVLFSHAAIDGDVK